MALRDQPTAASRFGPTTGAAQPPLCDMPLAAGRPPACALHLDGTIDLRPLGSVDLTGIRAGGDFRWQAYVATSDQLGVYGSARSGQQAWIRTPSTDWHAVPAATVSADTLDEQALAVALERGLPGDRRGPRRRGHRGRPGQALPRRRRRRDLRDRRFPQVRLLVGSADLHRWRGQLDYWVFLDGEVGQIAGSINGEATAVVPEALQGTVEVLLTATERGEGLVVYPPGR